MRRFYVLAFLAFFYSPIFSQDCSVPGNYCMGNINIQTCSGILLDDGAGDPYSDNNYTMTICPDTPGDVIQLDFTAFSLQTSANPNSSDYLSIYDGASTSAQSLGDYTGSSLQGFSVTGTVNNTTGCLTLVFTDNGNANTNFPGFQANISCTTPCANPTANYHVTDPVMVPAGGSFSTCVGEPISLDGSGSFAEPGFGIGEYVWNFDDGTSDNTSGATVSHTFEEPGEYLVSLTIVDNNGCSSLNLNPVQVLVSTLADFSNLAQIGTQYCYGQQIVLNAGDISYPTWSSLPPQVVAGLTELADGAGFSYNSPLTFDFFESDAVLESCDQFDELFASMEHSYLGDLLITLTCPNGTTVTMLDWPNGGGGDFLGEPIDDGGSVPGVPYTYGWASDSNLGFIDEQNVGFGESVPAGIYQPVGDICDFVGCPLNGTWTLSITDNLAADNGYVFEWGINFDPALYPGITTFTPILGGGADSSYWVGPNIDFLDAGHDVIELLLTEPGTYEYTYIATNNFGCINDTTISVTLDPPIQITAGPDQTFACVPLTLQGGYVDQPTPACGSDAGVYTYCYDNNANYVVTYCPDNPGDGFTVMQITIQEGSVEGFFDDVTFFDGQNTSAPILAGPFDGDLTGVTAVATNPSGCITMQITSDGSVSCASGSQDEMIYEVGCADPNNFVWSWSPADGLSASNSPQPTINTLASTTTYTLSGYPAGFPECTTSDDVVVTVNNTLGVDLPQNYLACVGEEVHVNPPVIIGGAGPFTYNWTGDDGSSYNTAEFDVTVEGPVEICVEVTDQCNLTATDCLLVAAHPEIPATFSANISAGCEPLNVTLQSDYTAYQNVESMTWEFGDGNTQTIMGSSANTFATSGSYFPILNIVDVFGCNYTDTLNSPIIVFPAPFASFNVENDLILLPNTTFNFSENSIDADSFVYYFDQYGMGYTGDTTFTFPAEQAAIYNVGMLATNQFGCVDSTYRTVEVQNDIDIYIPNAFTPDGDGINDFWKIEGKGFVNLNFKATVFNRWGDVIFQSDDPSTPWLGDDMRNGYFVQDGVYFFIVEVQDVQYDIKYKYQGHVTLLR